MTNLCFGENYQKILWEKELNVLVRKKFSLKSCRGGGGWELSGKTFLSVGHSLLVGQSKLASPLPPPSRNTEVSALSLYNRSSDLNEKYLREISESKQRIINIE